ncbi:DUF445 family protein [Clostridium tarantellae]|uniref:DUF445 family protein n=1 Tax=Clostridium tarantellae TaxID=39493 RepID=A0A6I1MJ99_9CLOT|nr:DUF445 family protein [Clostridium tarantellae]MPQ42212.1 DUF445 family protein [Clostridium tarantellae]
MKAYILGALIGGIIGYITNWLAIKMLFRPYKAKYFLGIKVPFTPGVIPKEKNRIAKSVGKTVGIHLLNKDTLIKALSNSDIKSKGKYILNNKINKIFDNNFTLDLIFANFFKREYLSLKNKFINKFSNEILKFIIKEDSIKNISILILDKVNIKLNENPIFINKLIEDGTLKNIILNLFKKYKYSGNLQDFINKKISLELSSLVVGNKKIKDVLPKESMNLVQDLLMKEKKYIAEEIKIVIKKDSVADSIKKVINNNIPSIVSMFLSTDSIYEKIVSETNNYLDQDENQKIIINTIVSIIANYSEHSFAELLNKLPKDSLDELVNNITDYIGNKFFEEKNIDNIVLNIENNLKQYSTYHSLLISIDNNYEEKIKNILDDGLKKIFNSQYFSSFVEKSVEKFSDQLLQTSTNDICYNREQIINKIDELVEKQYEKFISENAEEIVNIIDIPKLVEEQINSFELSYGEKIILDIANSELKAITWLGALLGAILGIISPLLANFYM